MYRFIDSCRFALLGVTVYFYHCNISWRGWFHFGHRIEPCKHVVVFAQTPSMFLTTPVLCVGYFGGKPFIAPSRMRPFHGWIPFWSLALIRELFRFRVTAGKPVFLSSIFVVERSCLSFLLVDFSVCCFKLKDLVRRVGALLELIVFLLIPSGPQLMDSRNMPTFSLYRNIFAFIVILSHFVEGFLLVWFWISPKHTNWHRSHQSPMRNQVCWLALDSVAFVLTSLAAAFARTPRVISSSLADGRFDFAPDMRCTVKDVFTPDSW